MRAAALARSSDRISAPNAGSFRRIDRSRVGKQLLDVAVSQIACWMTGPGKRWPLYESEVTRPRTRAGAEVMMP